MKMLYLSNEKRRWQKNIALSFIIISLTVSSLQNLKTSISSFRYMYRWRGDIVFDIVSWFRKHYSPDTSIVADHPVNVYLPPEYKNTVFVKFQKDKVEQLRSLVNTFRPQLVYYNTGTDETDITPSIREILPSKEVQLIASFDSMNKYYKRYPHSRYLVYEIKYQGVI